MNACGFLYFKGICKLLVLLRVYAGWCSAALSFRWDSTLILYSFLGIFVLFIEIDSSFLLDLELDALAVSRSIEMVSFFSVTLIFLEHLSSPMGKTEGEAIEGQSLQSGLEG